MEDSIPRGQLAPGEDSWHLKAYRWGMKHGKAKKPGYRENLCHYMRVILIWVPIFWFFRVPIRKQGLFSHLKPWEVIFLGIGIPFLGYYSYVLFQFINWSKAWQGFWDAILHPDLVAIALLLFVAVSVSAVVFHREVEGFIVRHKKYFEPLLYIGVPIYYLCIACRWLVIFVFKPRIVILGVWSILLLLALGIFAWQWPDAAKEYGIWIATTVAVGIIGVIAIVLVVFFLFLMFSDEHLDLGHRLQTAYAGSEKPRVVKRKGTSFFRMLWHFVRAKKYKICPFIILPEDRVQMAVSED